MKKGMQRIAASYGGTWYERISALFVGTILCACLSVFEGYWWPESFAISYYTIAAVAVIHFIVPLSMWLLRSFLQLSATIVVVFRLAKKDWVVLPPSSSEPGEWLWWAQQHLAQLHPFIWFGLSLMALQMLLGSWSVTRPRLFGVVGAGILLLTVADSFTPIWLWDNVAVVVFAGLIWLVVNHLASLQRRHPSSWKELLEYPIGLLSPAIIVLSLLMLVGVNMPSLPPLLQDPYTLWKNARGEEVSVFLGDKAIIRDAASANGNASSGYSRDDGSLGGGFDYDYSPMMTVTTTRRSYWRGESKDNYTGTGWVDSQSLPQSPNYITNPVQKNRELMDEFRPLAETVEVDQTVTMIREDAYPVLFGAAAISKVNWFNGENEPFPDSMVWQASQWELLVRGVVYPRAYSITSQVTVLDEAALRQSNAAFAEPPLQEMYTELPDTLPDRVAQLAAEITAEGATAYDKAKLLENYLRSNYAYNNKPDLTKLSGQSTDFVDQFLFELWEGYCDYFSTAMAVMARTLDMPARWVKGFAPGALPADRMTVPGEFMEDINPDGAGTYTVRNSDAHSWVEIYFEGYGWIPFEPTAGFSFPYSMPEGAEPVIPDYDPAQLEEPAAQPSTENKSQGSFAWIWISAASIGLAGVAWIVIRRFGGLILLYRKLLGRDYSGNELIVAETGKLLRICKTRGLQREEHETLREAILRWSQSRKPLKEDFRYVLESFERAKYGAGIASKDETDRFVQKVNYLIGELKS
ncbi:transglutaminase TgpA family protein [Paenibacillus sp. CAU 1782]